MMRPNQQNKNRSRGRNNNNGGRKHVNPLSRSYESNGPDVKIRGNAAHIAEKYQQLARDAQASGDSVMAENYLQHAEHYFRIILAAQPQGMPRPDQFGADGESDEEFVDEAGFAEGQEQPVRAAEEAAVRAERQARDERQNGEERQPREQRQPREGRRQRDDRPVAAEGSAESVESQQPVTEAAEAAAAEPAAEAGEGEVRRPRRTRRPRRAAENAADPSAVPQPELGELPAFITAGGTTTAAE